MKCSVENWWSLPKTELLRRLGVSEHGLSTNDADNTRREGGTNTLHSVVRFPRLSILLNQIKSPIALLLFVATIASSIVGDFIEGLTILIILVASSFLGYLQEYRASEAVRELLARLEHKTKALRDGTWSIIPTSLIVPGDIVSLAAGNQVPADCRILECKELFVDQSALTGESFPAAKEDRPDEPKTALGERRQSLFFGSHVVSGSAVALVVATGNDTAFGTLAASLTHTPPPTEFETGVRNFGYLLLEVAGALSLIAFTVNITYERPALDVLLFTLALVVGMTPQLLPAIVTSTLAQGARRLARGNAIVRRLGAIADIGGVTILCTDKTGTLTEGIVALHSSLGWDGAENEKTRLYGYLNASLQSGYANILDDAIKSQPVPDAATYTKLDEIPYDFIRKRLSVLVRHNHASIHIVKGAFNEVISICASVEGQEGHQDSIDEKSTHIRATFEKLSKDGYRTLSVAYRSHPIGTPLTRQDEREMIFLGFLCFMDPPKQSALKSVRDLESNGIEIKMVTGDNRFVAVNVATALGVLSPEALITGTEIDALTDRALQRKVLEMEVFAEVDPNQKARIIRALKSAEVGVAYLGDGINDASALRAADVGISVDTAVEVTKEAADVVLVTKDLSILLRAVQEGRCAFANTLKYILLSTSANFGNMFSVVGASLFADFLPMLPKQILLLNILSDLPAMGLATDRVDEEMTKAPLAWNMRTISRSMIVYGVVSSVFDYITFGSLLALGVSADVFRTGWFMESIISEVLVLFVIRTHRISWRSSAGAMLTTMSVAVCLVALYLPYSPFALAMGFAPLPLRYGLTVAAILFLYLVASEVAKRHLNHETTSDARETSSVSRYATSATAPQPDDLFSGSQLRAGSLPPRLMQHDRFGATTTAIATYAE